MAYMRLMSTRVMLACCAISVLVLLKCPAIDLAVSSLFFDGRFHLRNQWWERALHQGVSVFLYASIGLVLVTYLYNKIAKAALGGIDGKKVLYLVLVAALGAGLLVNVGLKNNFGRARPKNIVQFGGTQQFTPAFVVAHECPKNCSFASGDASGAFFSLSLAMAFGRRRAWFVAGGTFGAAVSAARIASGAHFLSDVVVSFFVMLIVADALHHYMILPKLVAHSIGDPVPVGAGPQ